MLLVVLAWAGPVPGGVAIGDVPGSGGNWQEGRGVINAPVDEVHAWFLDFDHWPQRFPDITSAQTLARPARDQARVRFHSNIIGRELTLNMRWNERNIAYTGWGKGVNVQGKILLTPVGPRRTQVVMQSTADVHGLSGAFATPGMKRKRAFKKLRSDFAALQRLSGTRM